MAVTRHARRPLRGSRLRGVDISLWWALEDLVESSRHPLGVIAIIITIVAIVFIRRFLLGLPLLPRLHAAFLERLSLEVLFLRLLLFQVLCGLLFLRRLAPPITIGVILLYTRPQGPSVDRAL